jgi:FtsH-binding integral membrane protein
LSFNTDDTVELIALTRLVRERTTLLDITLLLSPPSILALLYVLPVELRESLVFDYTEPTLLTAFTSTFIHLDKSHLLVNLGVYALIVPVLFILSIATRNRRRFYTVFVTFLFVFPLVLSYLNLVIFRPSVAFGFSGVAMAFVGYLPFALANYLDDVFDVGPANQIAPMLFLLSLICIAVLSVQSAPPIGRSVVLSTLISVLVAVLSVLLYALAVYNRNGELRSNLRAVFRTPWHFELAVIAIVLIFAIQFVAFPPDPSLGDGVLNLYVHFLGYSLGFLVIFTAVEIIERLGWTETVL